MTSRPPLLVAALCAAVALSAPAAADAKPRYKITINHAWTVTEIGDCKSGTDNGASRIKTTTKTTSKWSETGYLPGRARRTGYRETTITTESTDDYVPSDTATTRNDINEVYSADQSDFELKKRNIVYAFENEEGDIEDVKFRLPKRGGKAVTKKLGGTHKPDRPDDERCTNTAEYNLQHTVTIERVD